MSHDEWEEREEDEGNVGGRWSGNSEPLAARLRGRVNSHSNTVFKLNKKSLNSVFVFTVFISIREMLFPTFTVPYFKLGTL